MCGVARQDEGGLGAELAAAHAPMELEAAAHSGRSDSSTVHAAKPDVAAERGRGPAAGSSGLPDAADGRQRSASADGAAPAWAAREAAGPPSTSGAGGGLAAGQAAHGAAAAPAPAAAAAAADAAHARGYALRKRGDFLGAVAAYTAALELQPEHFKALFNRAFSYDKARARPGSAPAASGCAAAHFTSSLAARRRRQTAPRRAAAVSAARSWASGRRRRRTTRARWRWCRAAALRCTTAGAAPSLPAWTAAHASLSAYCVFWHCAARNGGSKASAAGSPGSRATAWEATRRRSRTFRPPSCWTRATQTSTTTAASRSASRRAQRRAQRPAARWVAACLTQLTAASLPRTTSLICMSSPHVRQPPTLQRVGGRAASRPPCPTTARPSSTTGGTAERTTTARSPTTAWAASTWQCVCCLAP